MAVPTPTPAHYEQDALRAELTSVLESASFRRAPRLAHLLQYLCEKLFADEASRIKEYSIGVEVFERGDSFDQESDSIVRVEANRLRKRLAAYYAGEGAAHSWRITIPVGQYVPEFVPCETQLAAQPEAQPAPSVEPRNRTQAIRVDRRVAVLFGLLLVCVAVLAVFFVLQTRAPKSGPAPTPVAHQTEAQPEAVFGPPVGEEVRILAGSSRGFVDHAGKLWSADMDFSGGNAVKSSAAHIARTLDPDFFRTSRQGQFRYDIPLKKGSYELRLYFAETDFGPESAGGGGEGSRVFSVSVNGKPLLPQLDIVADAGAGNTADEKLFPAVSPAADGQLHLSFAGLWGKQALLSAMEILPGASQRMRPVRILARQSPYYSNDSQWWSPDNYFQGGQLANYSTPVRGTDDPEMYENERWGNFSYAVPVGAGRYTAVLHFAARHWNAGGNAAAARQVFHVYCNGKALMENFNLAEEAGTSDVVVRRFSGLEPNAQGKLLFNFVPVEGYASVVGMEILPQ